MRPRLGIVALAPIQYHTPLFQLLAERDAVDLDVLFLSDRGLSKSQDPEFGLAVAWDIDLLSGYRHEFLTRIGQHSGLAGRVRRLARWVSAHDVVIVNGYNIPWMILTMAVCRARRIPYLLRASSHPRGLSSGWQRYLRPAVTRLVVAGSSGALSMGHLNDEFYRETRARLVVFAPNSVDDGRFGEASPVDRSSLLEKWGLSAYRPVILFCGKLVPRKRPLDLVNAVKLLTDEITVIFAGDGSLADTVRDSLPPEHGVVTGFVNQSELPMYYQAADILVLPSSAETWGLVVNEAMAAGTLPVVSDMVGCASDLVDGVGEIYPCGDVAALAAALGRAVARLADPGLRDRVRRHADRYSLERTAAGYEEAALAVTGARGDHKRAATARRAYRSGA
jgi:glycosyltransferase involved in cell wall biosynthesis